MSYIVQIRPEAEADIEEAALWYEEQQQGLGGRYLNEVVAAVQRIAAIPTLYPVVYRNLRRSLLHKFPFAVYFAEKEDVIVIHAVLHGSRHPKNWKFRSL
ncbi:type II toxin-antitoxin system RelE/ParE family toxin [Rheinheimera maricola]|uniref:Type II toxin-antitoxin system RelE/ParE family toxin n=1 Tax=Rheinheimera maricola TaxID=2793282 RepID=A0ABS7XAP6_9GAMM|nr:type II toxin-antitoxin system RelE/ParE family toxin [Rheinheimera maricola]